MVLALRLSPPPLFSCSCSDAVDEKDDAPDELDVAGDADSFCDDDAAVDRVRKDDDTRDTCGGDAVPAATEVAEGGGEDEIR